MPTYNSDLSLNTVNSFLIKIFSPVGGAAPATSQALNLSRTIAGWNPNFSVASFYGIFPIITSGPPYPTFWSINLGQTSSPSLPSTWFAANQFLDGVYWYYGNFNLSDGEGGTIYNTSNQTGGTVGQNPYVTASYQYQTQYSTYSPTTPRGLANKAYVDALKTANYLGVAGQGVNSTPNSTNYRQINRSILISKEVMALRGVNITLDFATSLNTAGTLFTIQTFNPNANTNPYAYLNTIKNLNGNVSNNFTFNFPNNNSYIGTVPHTVLYPSGSKWEDGVYEIYLSNLTWTDDFQYGISNARNVQGTKYTIVRQTVDETVQLLGNCVNQSDPAQVAYYNSMVYQQFLITSNWNAYVSTGNIGYATAANTAIQNLQDLIDNNTIIICGDINYYYPASLSVTDPSNLKVTIVRSQIPNVTPTNKNQALSIGNTITSYAQFTWNTYNQTPCNFPNLNPSIPQYEEPIDCLTAFAIGQYNDGVYMYGGSWNSDDEPDSTWYCGPPAFATVKTSTLIKIANAPITTPRLLRNKDYAEDVQLPIVNTPPVFENYTTINRAIIVIGTILPYFPSSLPQNSFTYALTQDSNESFTLSVPNLGDIFYVAYLNIIKNTTTNEEAEFTFDFAPDATSLHQLDASVLYPQTNKFKDGVYECYLSSLTWLDEGEYEISEGQNRIATEYTFVTATVDSIIEQLPTCVDQNNPAQVEALVAINNQYNIMNLAWSAYQNDAGTIEDVNAALELLQELIANSGIACCSGLTMALKIGSTNQMILSYPSLPEGEYADQSGILINPLTGEEYTFTNFPTSSEDTELILTSNNIGAGTSFSDGVWETTVQYTVDGLSYKCTAHALVVTNARCCERKAQEKAGACKSLTGKAAELSAWLETAIDEFNYGSYSVSNGFIKKINAVCSSCGCGC